MLLAEFDITYVTQKAIKAQAIADHLAHLPLPDITPCKDEFPDRAKKLTQQCSTKAVDTTHLANIESRSTHASIK